MKEKGHSCSMHSTAQSDLKIQEMEIRDTLKRIKNKILVMSGKGGVGKSSISALLSVMLARKGLRVGLMDVDLHGPSIPRLLGIRGSVEAPPHPGKLRPVTFLPNLEVISIEVLMGPNRDVATIWRGPLKIGVIKQFIADILWSPLDYLIIDSPPGTGDEPLTVAQVINDAKAIIVTTPQEISLADVRKSINFCRQVHMDILGLVENMSGLNCPYCGKSIDLFKKEGGKELAQREGIRLLASLPIEPEFLEYGDRGSLGIWNEENLPFSKEFNRMVDQIIEVTSGAEKVKEGGKIEESKKEEKRISGRKVFAVPIRDGKLCSHFGHSDQFALIETEGGRITRTTTHTPPPHEPGLLPRWLKELGVDVVIAGGMGSRAQGFFRDFGIEVVVGAPSMSPEELVEQYLNDTLVTGENVCDH